MNSLATLTSTVLPSSTSSKSTSGASGLWTVASEVLTEMQQLNVPFNAVSFPAAFSENWATSLNFLRKMSNLKLQVDLIARSGLMKVLSSWQQSLKINEGTHASGIRPNAQFLSTTITSATSGDNSRWPQALQLVSTVSMGTVGTVGTDAGNHNSLLFSSSEWRISSELLLKMAEGGMQHTTLSCSNYLQTLRNSQNLRDQINQNGHHGRMWQLATTLLAVMRKAHLQRDVDSFLCTADLCAAMSWPSSSVLLLQMSSH